MEDWELSSDWEWETPKEKKKINEEKKLILYKEKSYKVIENLKNFKLPEKNQQIRLISKKRFNPVTFLGLIAQKETIEHAILVLFSLNKYAAFMILEMFEKGLIKQLTILISDLRNIASETKHEAVALLENKKKCKNVEIIYLNSHAKIICLKTKNNYYCIEGSGNMSSNARVEQYVFDNDKSLFEFTQNWIKEMKVYLKGKKELTIY